MQPSYGVKRKRVSVLALQEFSLGAQSVHTAFLSVLGVVSAVFGTSLRCREETLSHRNSGVSDNP